MQSNSTKFARRYDREFKENAVVKHDLTTEHLKTLETAWTKSLANAKDELPSQERALSAAQSNLRSLQGSRPGNLAAVNAWQQAVTKADGLVKKLNNRVNTLRKQIPEFETRLANVPKIRSFLNSLHQKAAIRFVVASESGDQDLVLIDGQGPKS